MADLLCAVLRNHRTIGHFDQLQVVDNQQIEPSFQLLPPSLAAEI